MISSSKASTLPSSPTYSVTSRSSSTRSRRRTEQPRSSHANQKKHIYGQSGSIWSSPRTCSSLEQLDKPSYDPPSYHESQALLNRQSSDREYPLAKRSNLHCQNMSSTQVSFIESESSHSPFRVPLDPPSFESFDSQYQSQTSSLHTIDYQSSMANSSMASPSTTYTSPEMMSEDKLLEMVGIQTWPDSGTFTSCDQQSPISPETSSYQNISYQQSQSPSEFYHEETYYLQQSEQHLYQSQNYMQGHFGSTTDGSIPVCTSTIQGNFRSNQQQQQYNNSPQHINQQNNCSSTSQVSPTSGGYQLIQYGGQPQHQNSVASTPNLSLQVMLETADFEGFVEMDGSGVQRSFSVPADMIYMDLNDY